MTDPECTPHPRPAFDGWLRLHRRDYQWAAERLDCSREYVRRLCLPWDDPKRADASARMQRKVVRLTGGAIRADDWHPPLADILRGMAA